MSKPHEQTWRLEHKEIAEPQYLSQVVMGPSGVVGAFLFKSEADLAVAAPAMARALLETLGAANTFLPGHVEHAIRSALKEAGVTLP